MIKNDQVPTYDELEVPDPDGLTSVVRRPGGPPRAVVQVLHGWAEHARRYERLAAALTEAGFAVYADDHRGHGQSAGSGPTPTPGSSRPAPPMTGSAATRRRSTCTWPTRCAASS